MLTRATPQLSEAWRAALAPLCAETQLVLAVSGGPDSLAMLVGIAAARQQGLIGAQIKALTVDHGLRAASAEEALAVARMCAALGVEHTIARLGPKPAATNMQAWGRQERYAALARMAGTDGLVLTAHTADDQAETFLMRAARGTGSDGLAAIRARVRLNGARVARPFLGWPRAQLHQLLSGTHYAPTHDPSNDNPIYTRVRFRRWLGDAPTPDGQRPVVEGLAHSAWIAALEAEALDGYAWRVLEQLDGAEFGFLDGTADLADVPLVVCARVLRLAALAVARTRHGAERIDLATMLDLAQAFRQRQSVHWTGAGAVLQVGHRRDGLSSIRAFAEAGRRGFPKIEVKPLEDAVWDGRYGVQNHGSRTILVRAGKAGDRAALETWFGRRLPARLCTSLPAAYDVADGTFVASVGDRTVRSPVRVTLLASSPTGGDHLTKRDETL